MSFFYFLQKSKAATILIDFLFDYSNFLLLSKWVEIRPMSRDIQSLIRFLYLAITWSNHDTSAYLNMYILHNSWFGTWRHCFQLATHFLLSYHLHLWWMIFHLSALRGRSRTYLRLDFTFRSLSYWPQGSDCKGLFLERAHIAPYPISHEANSTASCPHVYTPPHVFHSTFNS